MSNELIFNPMVKVAFILDHKLMHYRVPLFNFLVRLGYEVTVIHSGQKIDNVNFNQCIVKDIKIASFRKKHLPRLNDFQVVVNMQNLRYINTWKIALDPFRTYKLIDWTIGTSTFNGLSNQITFSDKLRNWLSINSNAIILYTDYAKEKYSTINKKKIFIANNTVFNPLSEDLSVEEKDSFLFIGTLNKRKGLNLLLQSFKTYLSSDVKKKIEKLVIIGSGEEDEFIKSYISENGLEHNIVMTGSVHSDTKKKEYFRKAIANISPNQAGLSVLESFSFGVPFVTNKNAISGGEHLNVIDNVTGYTYTTDVELSELLINIDSNISHMKVLGHQAFNYYQKKRSFKQMVNIFDEAIKFSLIK